MEVVWTHTDGIADGRDGAKQGKPGTKEEADETENDRQEQVVVPRAIVALIHNSGWRGLSHNHHIMCLNGQRGTSKTKFINLHYPCKMNNFVYR